jgi:acyl-CoA hydrolase
MRVVAPEVMARHLRAVPGAEPRIVAAGNQAVPWALLELADQSWERYRLFVLNAPVGVPDRAGVTLETPFVGAGMRRRESLAYYPCRLSLVPALLHRRTTPDVVALHVAPSRDEMLSLGVEVNILPAAIEAVRSRGGLVVAQVNPRMPYTYGDALLHVDEVDLAVEVDQPLGEIPSQQPGPAQQVIGEHVAALVPDGATVQVGIGAIPDAALAALTHRRELRVWSEMISDGIMRLEQAGAIAQSDVMTTSFAMGSAEFYDWIDGNQRVVFRRTERANDPAVIARQAAMTSINAALQVDLFAQANASYVNGQIYSGFGGQTDFVVGALHSAGGHAIIALPSWHDRTDSSTIVERLVNPATSFQHSYVVTEQGVAHIWGCPHLEQARQLVDNAAHPQARDVLKSAVARMG